jgi:triacylglycerol lipase
MPPDIAQKLVAIGRVIAVPQTNAIYAPLHQLEPWPGVKVVRDIKYGPAERNLLDVFSTENVGGMRPVLIYVLAADSIAATRILLAARLTTMCPSGPRATAWLGST